MRELTLSDHVASQLGAAEAQRQAAYADAMAQYEKALDERAARNRLLRERIVSAWREGRFFALFGLLLLRFFRLFSSGPPKPRLAEAAREEHVWSAGMEGERRVTEALARIFSDDWTLISGYRNGGGEIDKILVGPRGALAIEIKFVNGRVFCDGDRWWRDKYDRYGNCVEEGLPIADKRGRSPSAQVNDAASRLEAFLQKRSFPLRVARAVVLSHDSSEIAKVRNLTVDLIATVDQLTLKTVTASMPDTAVPVDVARAVELIAKDHAFHSTRRSRPSGPQPAQQVASGGRRAPRI